MTQANFPKTRDDGSFTVAARFSFQDRQAVERIAQLLAAWVSRKRYVDHVDLGIDFSKQVQIEPVNEHSLNIVFEGRPGSQLWKGWMVEVTKEIYETVDDITFDGFWDLVAERPHSAGGLPPKAP